MQDRGCLLSRDTVVVSEASGLQVIQTGANDVYSCTDIRTCCVAATTLNISEMNPPMPLVSRSNGNKATLLSGRDDPMNK